MYEDGTSTAGQTNVIMDCVDEIVRLNTKMDGIVADSNIRMNCTKEENSGKWVSTMDPLWAELVTKYHNQKEKIDDQARLLGINVDEMRAVMDRASNDVTDAIA